jgi:hypothetical protein
LALAIFRWFCRSFWVPPPIAGDSSWAESVLRLNAHKPHLIAFGVMFPCVVFRLRLSDRTFALARTGSSYVHAAEQLNRYLHPNLFAAADPHGAGITLSPHVRFLKALKTDAFDLLSKSILIFPFWH